MNQLWPLIQEYGLMLLAFTLTSFLLYHYLLEKKQAIKLSGKYREAIYEAQSKIFLNATQYLISGERDLAIREFLNAVDLNRETLETYFALGGLFRTNGEIEKAISIHRSLIAREKISEGTRLMALKELALDFDRGGFIDKAIETYKDVLKINRDQEDVILSLCRIYEDLQDWDAAYNYRVMLSKVGRENQAETISHILVQKAKIHFLEGRFGACDEDLQDAFRFSPSVSAKILKLRLSLSTSKIEDAKNLLIELLKQHPVYASFVFDSLEEKFQATEEIRLVYSECLIELKDFLLTIDDKELRSIPSVMLARVRILKERQQLDQAKRIFEFYGLHNAMMDPVHEALIIEYTKLLIDLGEEKLALEQTKKLLDKMHKTVARYFCQKCGYNSDDIFWRCPQCKEWETIQFRWKV